MPLAESLALWSLVVAALTLLAALFALLYAGWQLGHARDTARRERLRQHRERLTGESFSRAFMDGEAVLACVDQNRVYPDSHRARYTRFNNLRDGGPDQRLRRARVIHMLNMLDELAEDCELEQVDRSAAGRIFRLLVCDQHRKWSWLVEYSQQVEIGEGRSGTDLPWHYFRRKGERWRSDR